MAFQFASEKARKWFFATFKEKFDLRTYAPEGSTVVFLTTPTQHLGLSPSVKVLAYLKKAWRPASAKQISRALNLHLGETMQALLKLEKINKAYNVPTRAGAYWESVDSWGILGRIFGGL